MAVRWSRKRIGVAGCARLATVATACVLGVVALAASEEGAGPVPAKPLVPVYSENADHDVSPPLWLIPPSAYPQSGVDVHEPGPLPGRPKPGEALRPGPVAEAAKDEAGGFLASIASPLVTFEGTPNVNGVVPPDTTGDIGPRHIVEWVNLSFSVYDRAGSLLYGPVPGTTLWSGVNGRCGTANGGDPLVLYDALADRWVVSQLAFAWPHDFYQCVAVSQTGDPTGPWYRYAYFFDADKLNDYPKMGIWPDGYYFSVNQFDAASGEWRGLGVFALNRANMLTGSRPGMIYFDLFGVNSGFGGALPSDLDGPIPPPPGAPNYFLEVDDGAWGWGIDRFSLWQFHVDWANPSASTFGIAGQPNAVINLSAAGYEFDASMCGGGGCIPQPGGQLLDTLSDRLMYRLAYRNFGTHESLVASHTVDADFTDHAGVRWYEIRDPGGTPTVQQAGTFSPDAEHRWMGSAAMNGAGGIALGYNVASATTYPSIRYAGRLASDPPGTMGQGESRLVDGSGVQTGASRWGDYSMLTVDPTDDCTFWYLGEYYAVTGPRPWKTRLGGFRLDGCGQCPLVGISSLAVDREGTSERLTWTVAPNASVYDVVTGSLGVLASTGGSFAAATTACGANDVAGTTVLLSQGDPAPGDGQWYLVRGVRNGCRGTLGETASAADGTRDAAIQSAAGACP